MATSVLILRYALASLIGFWAIVVIRGFALLWVTIFKPIVKNTRIKKHR
jgi:hypothetical protein